MDNETTNLQEKCAPDASMSKRFISYVLSRCTGAGMSVQSAQFDTLTGHATFASDFFFKPEELRHW